MAVSVFIARRIDAGLFSQVHADVFDGPVDPLLLERFLAADHLQIAVAVERDQMVGMCSGVIHHHPDKPHSWWINELGVAEPWRRQGIATRLVMTCMDHARRMGCRDIWVVADPTEEAEGFWNSLRWTRTGDRLAMFSSDL
jgi:ribosomal protein S18 acetylase RimI-like enzyme